MFKFLRTVDKSVLMVLVFIFSFVALLASKYLLSISLILLIPLALLSVYQQSFEEGWKKVGGDRLRFYRNFPPYWGFSLLFLVILFSGVIFGTSGYWEDRLRIRLPMLLAPFLFAFLPPLSKKHYKSWGVAVILIATISLALVLGNYAMDYDAIQNSISKGGSIPTPIAHIRYSVFIALAMVLSIWIAMDKDPFLGKNWKVLGILIASLLFIGLHILSVRSGLMAAYIGIATSLLHWTIANKKWVFGLSMAVFLGLTPIVAYHNIDSFKSKIDYSFHDFKMYQKGQGNAYSDGDRLESIAVGWKLFMANPIFGTGIGNFRAAVKDEYQKISKDRLHKMPHNQFVSILGSTGIVGFGIAMIGLLLPLFYRKHWKHLPLLSFYLIMLSSMLVENTLETSIGMALFILPILIMTNYLIGQKP